MTAPGRPTGPSTCRAPDAATGPQSVAVAPVSADDGPAFVAAVRASRTLHHPWIDLPDTPERFHLLLTHLLADDQAAYLVRHVGCDGLVGYVSVGNIVRRSLQSAYLGYGAFTGHDGRGLMTEGLRAVVHLAFVDLGLHRLEANIQPTNAPSIALARRLGFVKEGFSRRYLRIDGDWRDHERWALLADSVVP